MLFSQKTSAKNPYSSLKKYYAIYSTFLLAGALTACGGSGSSNDNSSGNNNIELVIAGENDNLVGESIELILAGNISDINWQQTSGPQTNILANNAKVAAFTANEAGDYSFEVSYLDANNTRATKTTDFTVTNQIKPITARLSHTAREGNKVSLRAWSTSTNLSYQWQQVDGPNVSLSNYSAGDEAIFFDAPSVSSDTRIVFQVSADIDGTTYTDKVSVLVEDSENISNSAYFDERVASVYPYNRQSQYKDVLVPCVYSNSLNSSCLLADLPLIAQDTTTPTVDDIMDRLVVSHDWMGVRFREFLENEDPHNDFKNLLRATTAVVISYDVRPSFYWAATGAIYLDANNFWLTPDERDTINEAPDYRAGFGSELQFVMPWRYVKDNNYANFFFASNTRFNRLPEERFYRLASLMYHELAHANDFFPKTEWFSHSGDTSILSAATSTNFESDKLAAAYPLASDEMRALARVSFHGDTANATQRAYQPQDVTQFFSPDDATDYYNYSSLREDYAMLFEELLMQNRFNVYRDVAVTNQPTGDSISGSDYIINWGQRGRVGEADIKPRVKYVTNRILPEFDADSALNNVIAPIPMTQGDNWIEALTIGPAMSNSEKQSRTAKGKGLRQEVEQTSYYHKPLPTHKQLQ